MIMNTANRFILILGITLAGTTALFGCTPSPSEIKTPPTTTGNETRKLNETNPIDSKSPVSNSTTCNQTPAIAYADATTQKVSEIARAVTVCITSQTPGSGVIIKRQGNVYTILTAAHVVATEDKYKVVAPDGKQYAIDYKTIKRFPDKIDLAILQFTSDQEYRVVEIGDSTKAVAGTPSYVAGFPLQSAESTIQHYRFSDGQISANAAHPLEEGYALAYWNDTFSGMSGGPLLDKQGRLIGIHGQSKVDADLVENKGINPNTGIKFGLNLAIPIHTFLSLIAKIEPGLEFQPMDAVIVPSQQTADDVFVQGFDKEIAGNRQGAIADYDKAIRLNPNYAFAYFNRGNSRYNLEDKKGAIADYDQAIRLNPNFASAYNNRGIARFALGDKKGAITDYDQAIRLNPNFAFAYSNRGLARSDLGDKKGAIADNDQAIRLNPNYAIAYYNRGNDRYRLGDKKGAIADYDQAIRLNPNYAKAYSNRGLARSNLGDKKGAIADYDQAIRINPNYADAYYNRGNDRSALGDKKGAIADFDQAIRINPNFADAYSNRGIARSALGDKKGAIADFDQAIRINPNGAKAYNNRGGVRLVLGDKKGAIADFDQAIRSNPNHANAYLNRGVIHFKLGDKQGAIADLQKSADLYQAQGNQAGYQQAVSILGQINC
jgi:tetratricopeptide (TPR) repeat protein/S1-C subfamily serine protease